MKIYSLNNFEFFFQFAASLELNASLSKKEINFIKAHDILMMRNRQKSIQKLETKKNLILNKKADEIEKNDLKSTSFFFFFIFNLIICII